MLSTLSSVKARLAIPALTVDFDDLLTTALTALSARFDRETSRRLTRTANSAFEFEGCETEVIPPCYPIESISKFETKSTEAEGWLEQSNIDYLIRRAIVVSLVIPLSTLNSSPSTCRLTYTGGYVMPGDTPGPGQAPLPPDLEQAAVEQVAYWFQNRDKLGLLRNWPAGGTYQQLSGADLLPSVSAVLQKYRRWTV